MSLRQRCDGANRQSVANQRWRHSVRAAWWLSPLAVGLALGLVGLVPVPAIDVHWVKPASRHDGYVPQPEVWPERELLLVYIGSSVCPPSNSRRTIEAVRTAKGALARVARSRKIAFSTIGIASDLVAADGLSHLRQIGMWDEISAGRRGRNSGMERYVYGDMPGASGTPQVLVVCSVGESIWAIPTERVLLRQVGLFAIEEWVAAGLPVPTGHLEK